MYKCTVLYNSTWGPGEIDVTSVEICSAPRPSHCRLRKESGEFGTVGVMLSKWREDGTTISRAG